MAIDKKNLKQDETKEAISILLQQKEQYLCRRISFRKVNENAIESENCK